MASTYCDFTSDSACGVRLQQKHKRIKVIDEESDGEDDDRAAIARQIFDDDDEGGADAEERRDLVERRHEAERDLADLDVDSGEESEDNFIVDEEGQPMSTHRKKRHVIHDDA